MKLGRFEAANREMIAFLERCGEPCDALREASQRGWERGGWEGSLRAFRTVLEQEGYPLFSSPAVLAMVHAWLGDREKAFAALERVFEEDSEFMVAINVQPQLDPLRSDPRFDDLRRRVGLLEREFPGARAGTGKALALSGRPSDAIARLEEAMEGSRDDPRLARWHYYMALAHFAAKRYERATTWAGRSLEQNPGKYTTADAHLILASSQAHLGSSDTARESLDHALRLWLTLTAERVPLPPYTDADLRERYVSGLRNAGLAE